MSRCSLSLWLALHRNNHSNRSAGMATRHEVINVDDIQQGENNIKFEVTEGTGAVRIADVVLVFNQSESGFISSTTAAISEIFQDRSFALRIGGDIDRTLEGDIQNPPIAGEGAILMWQHWREGSGPVSYRVSVNGTRISRPTISGDTQNRTFVSFHEMIGTDNIDQGENDVRFQVTDGTRMLRIADVALFYRSEIIQTTSRTVAGYELFRDSSVPLRIGDVAQRTMTADLTLTGPLQTGGAILMWKHWRIGTGEVSYRVSVNGTRISRPSISGDVPVRNFTTLHEVINSNDLSVGSNTVVFEVIDGSGTLRIGDVVLFYRNRSFTPIT